jgi:hypothetical protein
MRKVMVSPIPSTGGSEKYDIRHDNAKVHQDQKFMTRGLQTMFAGLL